ncbi:Ima1 N-terminal domain-containing protein [Gautieria morchelliformis]|nr:Ima1 N-terminal domain-containing protein [Gautieria morchelliformis]
MRVFQTPSPFPTCFFCLTTLSNYPRNSKSFKCPHCSCWNRYDEAGQIISDEPAMREESLNASSFAKRASPCKHRLPTSYGKGPFCHTCLTNQTLLMNMLSNYLPSADDPLYETRVSELPAYTSSLQNRYPPVCKDCQPSVDEELRKKEHMARTTALGGWLKRSRHVGAQRSSEQHRGGNEVIMWKVRGVLWFITSVIFVSVDASGMLQYNLSKWWLAYLLPVLAPVSLFWTFWDPTWASLRISRLQGRMFTVAGRHRYIRCQGTAWLTRLVTSVLIVLEYTHRLTFYVTPYRSRCWYATALGAELVLAAFALSGLQIQRPPTVRLLEPRSVKREHSLDSVTPTPGQKPDSLFTNLPLAPSTPSTSMKPIFGQPSFPSPVPDMAEEDLMDWTPIHRQETNSDRVQDREGWMRPQRFFPPEQPTGLEDLFEQAKLDVEEHAERQNQQQQAQQDGGGHQSRELGLFLVAAVIVALIAGLSVYRV